MLIRNRNIALVLLAVALLAMPFRANGDTWWGQTGGKPMSDEEKAAVDQLLNESQANREQSKAAGFVPVPSQGTPRPKLTQGEEADLRSDEEFRRKIQEQVKPIYDQEVLNLIPENKPSVDSFVPSPSEPSEAEIAAKVRESIEKEQLKGIRLKDLRSYRSSRDDEDTADEGYKVDRKKKKKKRRRVRRRRALFENEFDKERARIRGSKQLRVASREPNGFRSTAAASEMLDPERVDDAARVGLRLAVLGGYSTAQSSSVATATSQVASQNSFSFGINADYSKQYFGAELEGYYGLAPEKNQVNGQATFRQLGALLNVKAQLPLSLGGSTVLTPKVGLGYGLISQSQESISSEGINQSASTSITAPYGVVGAELSLTDSISVFADYAMSFGGKSSTKTTVAGIPGGETSLSARFDRIRFGGYVRVGKRVKVGGQYINRTLGFGDDLVTTDASEQFMGVLMYDF